MGNRIDSFKLVDVPGGVEVLGMTRSDRGTRYILKSVVIMTEGLSKAEINDKIQKAIEGMQERP